MPSFFAHWPGGRSLLLSGALWLATPALPAAEPHTVLVEAENFTQTGGWLVDPQFMDQMGSPFLLAHGLGQPVADATTDIELPAPGNYRVLVRTRDWVAGWRAPGAPGKFQVIINGQTVPTVFGTAGSEWHWQEGNRGRLPGGKTRITLHDLTGFEGRCDAILLTTDETLVPPNLEPAMGVFRRKLLGYPEQPEAGGEFDLVVTGGGIAGTCAAIGAARLGLQVALVQDRPVLGGNNSSEVRVWLQGARNKEPWPRVGDLVAELEQDRRAHYGPANTAALYEDKKKLAVARSEPNLRLFLEHRVNQVETNASGIRAVIAQDTRSGRRFRLAARWFADCTGDGAVGALAGADFDLHLDGHMGPCNLWNVTDTGRPVAFPACPWALDLSKRPFPGRNNGQPDILQLGGWYWESGFHRHPITEMEYMRDWNFRAMYGAWDALKNIDKVLPNHQLNWCAHIMGKRESRRLLGDLILQVNDLRDGHKYPDGCVPTGWKIDLHLPDPKFEKGFEGDAFIAKADFGTYPLPYWVPYRCLYSRNIPNLFMAGRDISVTHEALGGVRVMRTGGCMGEIVGMAASLCKAHGVNPRDIYLHHLSELQDLMRRGVGRQPGANPAYENQGEPGGGNRLAFKESAPAWLKSAGTNLARLASIRVSGSKSPGSNPPSLLTDGRMDLTDNTQRWISETGSNLWVELAWKAPQSISAVRVVSGYQSGGKLTGTLTDFSWQRFEDNRWQEIDGTTAQGNNRVDWSMRFKPVRTDRLRLVITGTPNLTARIWEVEVYGDAGNGMESR